MLANIDWGAIGTIGGLLLAIGAGIVRLIVLATRLSAQVQAQGEDIRENTRHVASIMANQWSHVWRITSVEDYLQANAGYRPPRLINEPPPDEG